MNVLAEGMLPLDIHTVTWDGTDENTLPVPTSVYCYRLEIEGKILARKVLLLW